MHWLQDLQLIINRYGQRNYFEKEKASLGSLSNKARKKLIRTIVDWTTREFIWLSLKDFPKLFSKIKEIFQNENEKLYFIARGPGNPHPSGQLYNAFRRSHEALRAETGISRNQKTKSKKPNKAEFKELPAQVDAIRQRLIDRSEPWDKVLTDWKETFVYRRKEVMILPTTKTLTRWPKFKKQRGYEMVIILK